MSIKAKSAKYAKMQRGEYQSKICPYGYRKSADGRMEPDPEAAAVVQLIFQLAAEGNNGAAIARELFRRDIPTPGEYKAARGNHTHDISRTRGIWSVSTVLRMQGELSLTLIKCGTYPNEQADQGRHTFTYSLYPHNGNFKQGGIIKEAYKLNRRMTAILAEGKGKISPNFSLANCNCENIIIETIKQAENGQGIVMRLYEAWNKKTATKIKFGFEAKKIFLCDLLENKIKKIGTGNEVSLDVNNFEIVTLLLEK